MDGPGAFEVAACDAVDRDGEGLCLGGCLGGPARPAEGVLGEAQRLGNDPVQVAEAQA